MCKTCVIGSFWDGLSQFSQTVSKHPRMHQKTSEMVQKYFQNGKILLKRCAIFFNFLHILMLSYCIQNPDAVDSYWSQDHPTWSNFRMVPYPTVLRLIDLLSDDKYDTVPKQPPPSVPSVPSKQSQKTKAELKQKPAATGGVALSTSSSRTSLHEVPPPDDPLEEQNIWCEMLLLEGRKTNNKIAEGFVWWLDKNLDATIHKVKIIYLS